MLVASSCKSVQVVMQRNDLRIKLHENARIIKQILSENQIPVLKNPSHIIPVFIGDALKCKAASDMLLEEFNIYI